MVVQWRNILVVILLITACVTVTKNGGSIAAFLSTIDQVGSGTPDEQVRGLLAVGLLGVIVVSIVRILVRKD